jgi:Arc/MetJ family transcription regulator
MHHILNLCINNIGGNYGDMRTTLDLPEELLNEAMKVTRIRTKTKVIITALEDLIRKSKISELKEFKGKIDLDIDLNQIRGRQCRY